MELAILLPFLCFLFVVAVDFARIFYFSLTVTNCARNGALYASSDPNAAVDKNGIETAARRDAGNLKAKDLTVTSTPNSTTSPTFVAVTVTYPFTTITTYPGVPHTMTITRTVKMTVSPLVPN